jgi:hypothetical protein
MDSKTGGWRHSAQINPAARISFIATYIVCIQFIHKSLIETT